MFKVSIDKESTPKALEEKIQIYLDQSEVNKYVQLLKKTWPKTSIKTRNIRKYA